MTKNYCHSLLFSIGCKSILEIEQLHVQLELADLFFKVAPGQIWGTTSFMCPEILPNQSWIDPSLHFESNLHFFL